MAITIRPLAEHDRAQWADLWRAYLQFYNTELSDRIFATTWQRLLTNGEDPHGLCAVASDDRMIGIVHYIFHRSCWTDGPYCYLQDLYVAETDRGAGIGGELIRAVYDAAAQHGASQVYWLTQDHNQRARRLYDQVAQVTPFIKYMKPLSTD